MSKPGSTATRKFSFHLILCTVISHLNLLLSARKHTEDYLRCTLEQNSSPNSPLFREKFPKNRKNYEFSVYGNLFIPGILLTVLKLFHTN
jgi:hypothetical protein